MEIEQLKQFVKVAELANFTRAAEALGLSQPALSRSIARLEEELGQPVFERQTRRVSLTDAGNVLLDRARTILAMVDDVKSEINDDGETGTIRVAAIPTIAPYFLPPILKSFASKHPAARITVREDTTDNLVRACHQGEVDLVIMAMPLNAKYLKAEELFEEELLVVLPVGHPLAKKKRLVLADVEPLPFVILGETHCLSENILSFCRRRSFHPVTVERTSQLTTVQELVSLHHGVSMIPEMASRLDTSRHRIYRSLADSKPTRRVAMVWNPYRFQSRLHIAFQKHVKEYSSRSAR